jgi:hypothetical protein
MKKDSPIGLVTIPPIGGGGKDQSSWLIKVWKIDKKIDDKDFNSLPNEMGGDILNK